MSITFDADDPRTIKALQLAAEADRWLSGRNQTGEAVFGVPSQRDPRQYYIVTTATCDCPDFVRSAETPSPQPCKHILAVRLHCELVRGQRHLQRQSRRDGEARRGHLELVR